MDGIINVYKEKGFTSHDVVAKLRGIVKQKKIGHTGTLDPDATGVLPVCLGKATKVCDLLTNKDKEYCAKVQLGVITDTLDLSGTVLEEREVNVTEEQIIQAASSFIGEIFQVPPMYSAIKINGKKLYELAREGKEIERKPRKVTIHNIEISDIDLIKGTFYMKVSCSKGTYIRSLCMDIGERLSCGAAMAELVRERVGNFIREDAYTLTEIEEYVKNDKITEILYPIDFVFSSYQYGSVERPDGMKRLQNGNALYSEDVSGIPSVNINEWIRIYDLNQNFYAIYQWNGTEYKVVKMFH